MIQEFTERFTEMALGQQLMVSKASVEDITTRLITEAKTAQKELIQPEKMAAEIKESAIRQINVLNQFTPKYLQFLLDNKIFSDEDVQILVNKMRSDALLNKYVTFQQNFLSLHGVANPDELIHKLNNVDSAESGEGK